MGSWLAAFLITPIFGLSLQLQPMAALDVEEAGFLAHASAAVATAVPLAYAIELETEAPTEPTPAQIYADQLRTRAARTRVHRAMGIATWVAMTATVVSGFIQYYNLYGIFADQGSNPCVQGNAIFGQGQCSGTPWAHRGLGFATTGLYAGTFALSLMMPDPDDSTAGDGEFARNLRLHKTLRWVHLAGMVAQVGLGLAMANNHLGLDRANDYRTLQALGTVHMGIGLVTWGALSWAAATMVF